MKISRREYISIVIAVSAFLVSLTFVACGGGGSDSTSPGTTPPGAGASGKVWGTPVLLEASANPAYTPAVAADPDANGKGDGTVTVVWEQSDGDQDSIYASRYNGTWSTPVTIETQSTGGFSGGASAPRVAMNRYGQAAVAWVYSTGPGNYRIWSNRFDNSAWQTEENIGAVTGNANSPQVAFDGTGDAFYTVWSQYLYGSSQYNYRIVQRAYYYGRCADGSVGAVCVPDPGTIGWQSMSMVDSHDVGDAGEPQIAAWSSRNAVAVWTQNTLAGNQIWANIVTDGTWSAPERINGSSTNGAAAPVVAADGSGNAVAVWMEWAPGRKTLYASRYALGAWSTPVQIDDPAGDNAGGYDPPRQQVVMDASGNVLVLWQQEHGNPTESSIYARRCPAGTLSGCSAPVRIEQSAGFADFPALALAPNGDAIAVWKQEDGSARRIYASLFSAASGTWSAAPGIVGGADSTWNEGPQIAVDGSGNATVVWTEYESGQYNIRANRYE